MAYEILKDSKQQLWEELKILFLSHYSGDQMLVQHKLIVKKKKVISLRMT